MALFTPNVVINQPSNPKPLDLIGMCAFSRWSSKLIPLSAVTRALVDGATGVSVEQVTGTWSGPCTDPATGATMMGKGRKFDLDYADDHRIRSVTIYWDRLIVNQQLGLIPK